MSSRQEGPPRTADDASAHWRVLLLEDSKFDAELLIEALRAAYGPPDAGPRVHWVSDESSYSAALTVGGFDLILSDYELAGFSGGQALDLARAKCPQVPFIFVSGVIGEDNAVELLKRGATDYVSKGRLSRLPVVIDRARREVAQRQAYEDAQAQLQEAGITLDSVVDSLRDYAVMLLSPQGIIRTWNRAAEDVFGYTAAQALGQPASILFTEEDRAQGVPQVELRNAHLYGKASDDRWMVRADGSRLWAEGSVTRLDAGIAQTQRGFCKIIRDATASHAQAQALREAKEEAERANRAKDRFLAVLSHELRTPLTPIASAAHILQRVAQVPGKFESLLPMIERNVALEARLIDDLLDLTAISEGKLVLRKAQVDVHRLIHAVAEMVADQVRDKALTLALDLWPWPALIEADEARLQQVLWNLLRNAIKFTPERGRVSIRTSMEGGTWRLECSDTGIGIDPLALPRIFLAFEQADAEVSRRFGGLGLGLAIAKGLVGEHGGEISVSSAGRGKGATFTLSLPLLPARPATEDGGHAVQPDAALAADGCRVIVVEDNEDAAEALMMSLEAFGYDVRHAMTRSEGLRLAREERFDAVVTDLGLPDGSGIELGMALRGALPIIALSGYGAPQDMQRSAEAGFAAHLVKPADPALVHAALQKVLGAPMHRV